MSRKNSTPATVWRRFSVVLSLCGLWVLCIWVVSAGKAEFGIETAPDPQGPELDYSTFKHTSQRHASLACTDCHQRASNNSATPSFPGHGCMNCHGQQLQMCTICHTNLLKIKRAYSFQAGDVDPILARVGATLVVGINAALGAEIMFCRSGVKLISRQVLSARKNSDSV